MSRIEALKQLADKVEAGECVWPDDAHECPLPWGIEGSIIDAYTGSLDAAKALHEAVLSEWVTWDASHTYFGHEVSLTNGPLDASACLKDNPARAWLLAILKALIAQDKQT